MKKIQKKKKKPLKILQKWKIFVEFFRLIQVFLGRLYEYVCKEGRLTEEKSVINGNINHWVRRWTKKKKNQINGNLIGCITTIWIILESLDRISLERISIRV